MFIESIFHLIQESRGEMQVFPGVQVAQTDKAYLDLGGSRWEVPWLGDILWVAGPPQIHGSHPAFKWAGPQGPV